MEEKLDPDAAFKKVMELPDGWRKIAACMISPIRMKLKIQYGLEMTKDQEVIVEAEVYRAHIVKEAGVEEFGYREANRLQDRLIKEFRGDV